MFKWLQKGSEKERRCCAQMDAMAEKTDMAAESIRELVGSHQELAGQLRELCEQQKESGRLLRRQSVSFEDFLEEEHENREERMSWKAREQAFTALAACLREQQLLTEEFIQKGISGELSGAWQEQRRLMEQAAAKQLALCGLTETGTVGEKADPELCQILELLEPEHDRQAGCVARVYSHGLIYESRVIKKARVAVYKQ